jgi:hypothetical protein
MPQELGYIVEVSTNAGSTWTQLADLAPNTTSYQHTGLTASTTRHYRVKAKGNGTSITDSTYSATVNATTTAAASQLSAPATFGVEAVPNGFNFIWTDVANESSYALEASTDGTAWSALTTAAANATSVGVTGYSATAFRFFRIKAVGNGTTYADSAYSTIVNNAYIYSASEENAVAYNNLSKATNDGNTVSSTTGVNLGAWDASATCVKSLPASTNGYIQAQLPSSGVDAGIVMDDVAAFVGGGNYTQYNYMLWAYNNQYYFMGNSGVTNSLYARQPSDIIRIERIGANVYYKVARASTPTYFTTIASKAAITGILYFKVVFSQSSVSITNVKIMGAV